MRLVRTAALLAALLASLLLSACGGSLGDREREDFLEIRTSLLEREKLSLRADLRADYGDRVYDYRLSYVGNAEEGVLRIEEPLELEDVRVELKKGHARLRYGDLMLDTGALAGEESPVQAFPLMIRAWLRGSVAECWHERMEEEDCTAAEIHLGGAGAETSLVCRVWFRRSDGEPVFAELAAEGRVCLTCRFLPRIEETPEV